MKQISAGNSLQYKSFNNIDNGTATQWRSNSTLLQRVSDGLKSLGNLLCCCFQSERRATFNVVRAEPKKLFNVSASIRIPPKPEPTASRGPDGIFMARSSS